MKASARFLVALILLLAFDVRNSMAELSDSQVKSAYVFNFVKFTEWPSGTVDGRVTLCVVGSNVLGGALTGLDGIKSGARELHVVQHAGSDDLRRCQVVYIGESEQRRFLSIIKALDDAPVLTISDIEDFAEKGGGIGLRYRENKIVFEVNLAAVRKSKLHLPAQLLNLAFYVFRR